MIVFYIFANFILILFIAKIFGSAWVSIYIMFIL